jgi:hypothetical protein
MAADVSPASFLRTTKALNDMIFSNSNSVIFAIPAHKLCDTLAQRRIWAVACQAVQQIGIGPSGRHIARLHRHHFAQGFALQFLFQSGDKIQQIVTEKSQVRDVRPATVIDFVYACLLYYFKALSTIPMSTTWVFIGLLAGRELAMSITDANGKGKPMSKTLRLIAKDVSYAGIGLLVSILLAMAINPVIMQQIKDLIGY